MKKIIATAAVLAVTSVSADELKFGDLNYLIPQGKFNLSTDLQLRAEKQDSEVNGTTTTKNKQEGWYLDTLLTYGFCEKTNFFFGLNYQYEVKVEDLLNTGNADYKQDGLANPILGGIYRFMNQESAKVNLDFGVIGRINIMDDEIGDSSGQLSKDGNAADARHSLELFARAGKKWNEANEWQLTAGLVRHFEGESEELNATGGASKKHEKDASMDLYLRAGYQYRPVNEFMMAITLQATQVGKTTTEDKSSGVETDLDSHLDWDMDFVAKYLITTHFIGRFQYGLGRNPDIDGKAGNTDFKFRKRTESRIGLGVDWLF